MKNVIKIYCCKEVKHISHIEKDKDKFDALVMYCIQQDYNIKYNVNLKSRTLSMAVDCESTAKWVIEVLMERLG